MAWKAALVLNCVVLAVAAWIGSAVAAESAAFQAGGDRPSAPARLTGRVVDATSGRPISEAVVTLSQGSAVAELLTNSDGDFAFARVVRGTFRLVANHPRYLPHTASEEASMTGLFSGSNPALVAELRLAMPSVVTGRVLGTDGDPVQGVTVQVHAEIDMAADRVLAAGPSTITDDRGDYVIGGLAAGRYYVCTRQVPTLVPRDTVLAGLRAGSGSNRPSRISRGSGGDWLLEAYIAASEDGRRVFRSNCFDHADWLTEATSITLGVGETRGSVDLELREGDGYEVRGRLLDPSTPLRSLLVRLLRPSTDGNIEQVVALTVTDLDGTFRLAGVPPGSFMLEIATSSVEPTYRPNPADSSVPRPYAGAHTSNRMLSARSIPPGLWLDFSTVGNEQPLFSRVPLRVVDRDLSELVVTPIPLARIEARVVWDEPGAVAASFAGQRIPALAEGRGDEWGVRRSLGVIEPNGELVFGDLLPGRYTIRPGVGHLRLLRVGGVVAPDQEIQVIAGAVMSNVEVVATLQSASISGAVRQSGRMVSGGTVVCFTTDSELWRGATPDPSRFRVVAVRADGSYRCTGLSGGVFAVIALDSSWSLPQSNRSSSYGALLPFAARVSVPWGGEAHRDLVVSGVR